MTGTPRSAPRELLEELERRLERFPFRAIVDEVDRQAAVAVEMQTVQLIVARLLPPGGERERLQERYCSVLYDELARHGKWSPPPPGLTFTHVRVPRLAPTAVALRFMALRNHLRGIGDWIRNRRVQLRVLRWRRLLGTD